MNEVQSRLLNLESVVKELNILYKYCYTEDDLIKLNESYSIEQIDETKDNVESLLFSMIIDAVLEGAKPQDKTVYRIISAFKYALGLKEVAGADRYKEFENKVNLAFNEQVCYN